MADSNLESGGREGKGGWEEQVITEAEQTKVFEQELEEMEELRLVEEKLAAEFEAKEGALDARRRNVETRDAGMRAKRLEDDAK